MKSDVEFVETFGRGTSPSESSPECVAAGKRISARNMRLMLYGLSLLLDCGALVAGFSVAMLIREDEWLTIQGHPLIWLALPIFLMFSIARELQSVETLESRSTGVYRTIGALATTAFLVMMLIFLMKDDDVSRIGFAITFGASAVFMVGGRILLDWVFRVTMKGNATAKLLILDGVEATPEDGMDVVDVCSRGLWPDLMRPEMIDALSHMIARYDQVVVACRDEHRKAWSTFLRGSDVGGEIILDRGVLQGAVAIGQCGQEDTLILSRGPLSLANRIQKRTFDLVVGLTLLLLLAPLFVAVAVAIKFEGPGPVFFRQVRVGQGNRQFRIFKFRSMRADASDQAGARSTDRLDDRVTSVGAFIRSTSIDELPQLFNVLLGEMSLVGPRPHALGSLAGQSLFWEVTDRYWMRHALKPGMTGLAQIRGFRGSTTATEDLTQRLRCDLEYLSDWSMWKDFLICVQTISVLTHKNAY